MLSNKDNLLRYRHSCACALVPMLRNPQEKWTTQIFSFHKGKISLTLDFSSAYVIWDLHPVIGLSHTKAFWPPRPSSTCLSTALKQRLRRPPTNHFVKGEAESSSTLSHFLVQTTSSAILAQYSSGWCIDLWNSCSYWEPENNSMYVIDIASFLC